MENRSVTRGLALCAGTLALVLAGGCGGKGKKDVKDAKSTGMTGDTSTSIPKVDPKLCNTKGKKITTFDLNRDNKPDVWKLYKTVREGGATLTVLTCKQVDFDRDGRHDYVAAFNNKGGYIFEKFDYDFDGRFDAVTRYDQKTGQKYLVERDSDFDGKYDIVEKYDENGVITSVRRDRNGDTTPDVWEQYVGGELVAILYDDDYDKKVDRREEIKAPKTPDKKDGDGDKKEGDGDGDKKDGDGDKKDEADKAALK